MNPYIEINPRVCNGRPVIAGTRIPVSVILDQLADGASREEVRRKFPGVTDEQITAVLQYCHALIEHTDIEPLLVAP
jgi:uncharacterized protein (DUF433 family)